MEISVTSKVKQTSLHIASQINGPDFMIEAYCNILGSESPDHSQVYKELIHESVPDEYFLPHY